MVTTRSRRRLPGRSTLQQFIVHVLLMTASILCLLPMILIISASFSAENDIALYGYSLIPRNFTTFAYSYILKVPSQLIRSYSVTLFVTTVGTTVGLLMMALFSYALSRPEFTYRKPLAFLIFFTMLFNGGLVPFYILVTQYLHLKNTIWVLILPALVVPWYVLLLRTYMVQLPSELFDAARIDGASEWRTFFQIAVPLSTPALATVGLFMILNFWNDWWLPLLFIDDPNLRPLQYMLYAILTNAQALAANPQTTGITTPIATVRMAMVVLATGPAVLAFLLVQRFFIRGLTVGAIKS